MDFEKNYDTMGCEIRPLDPKKKLRGGLT